MENEDRREPHTNGRRYSDDVSLRDYIERILSERETAARAAFSDMEKRLDTLNELRSAVEADRSQFVRLDTYDEKHESLRNEMLAIEERLRSESKERERRLTELERNSVRNETLQSQQSEVQRTRKALVIAIIAGGALTVFNLILNIVQGTGGKLP